MKETLIISLDGRMDGPPELVGGKASNLIALSRLGLPVPGGFCLTTAAYLRFVRANGLEQIIESACEQFARGETAAAAERIRDAFFCGMVPPDIRWETEHAWRALGPECRVAVRSSATAEDLATASFAGGQATELNVCGADDLWRAIRQCWASLWTERVMAYRRRLEVPEDGLALAVVVQEMVEARASGVLFTIDPVTGDNSRLTLEACHGLGKPLVSGEVTPDHYEIRKSDLSIQALKRGSGNVNGVTRRAASLSTAQAREIAGLGLRVESAFGCPQDIEWALDAEGGIFLLQARPVSTAPAGNWESPVPGAIWVRRGCGGLIEYLPEPPSPLYATGQIARICRLHDAQCPEMGVLTPQPTWTLINGHFYSRQDYQLGLSVLRLPFGYWRSAKGAARHWREQVQPAQEKRLAEFSQLNLSAASIPDLIDHLDQLLDFNATAWDNAVRASRAYVVPEPVFARIFDWWIRPVTGGDAVTFLRGFDSRLMAGEKILWNLVRHALLDRDIERVLRTQPPQQALERLAAIPETREWLREFLLYCREFGHLTANQDYLHPMIADDLCQAIASIQARMALPPADPSKRLVALQDRRCMETLYAFARLFRHPLRRRLFAWSLRWAQEGAAIREDIFFYALKGWPLARRAIVELGRRLQAQGSLAVADDIFFVTWEELRQLTVKPIANELVRQRRAAYEENRRLSPPPVVSSAAPDWRRRCVEHLKTLLVGSSKQSGNGVLRGSPASPGVVTGPARILHSASDFSRLRTGDILVTRVATPDWTPAFAVVAGLVTDTGGPLSHSSIIAREFSIPAVMGVPSATRLIRDGQIVTVDGGGGMIRLHLSAREGL